MTLLEAKKKSYDERGDARRNKERIKVVLPVSLNIGNKIFFANTLDFSTVGMSISSDANLRIKSIANVIIKLKFGMPDLEVKVRVQWKSRLDLDVGKVQYKYGLEFIEGNELIETFYNTINVSESLIYDRRGNFKETVIKHYSFKNSVKIKASADKIYSLIKHDLKDFSRFMRDVEEINILDKTEDFQESQWNVIFERSKFSWKQRDSFNDSTRRIDFISADGPFREYQGYWEIKELGDKETRIILNTDMKLNVTNLEDVGIDIFKRHIRKSLRTMLLSIKREVEYGEQGLTNRIISSRLIEYENREGKKIVGFYDHMKGVKKDAPFMIVLPGYGETKRDVLNIAYYFAVNGFNVIRYDATDHIGESDGEIFNTTMTKLTDDLLSTIDFIEKEFVVASCGVIASSLAARAAIKATAIDKRIIFFSSLVGVVDLQATLKAVYGEDIILDVLEGRIKETYELIGFDLSNEFFFDAIKKGYHNLDTTLSDVRKIKIPLAVVGAKQDVWVDIENTKTFSEASLIKEKNFFMVEDTMHQLFENPDGAKEGIKYSVAAALKYLFNRNVGSKGILEPESKQLAVQNRKEKERLKKFHNVNADNEKDFWEKYMIDFALVTKLPDYRQYLEVIEEQIGPYKRNHKLLDAGCGIGHYGAWLFAKNAKEFMSTNKAAAINYLGLDFTEKIIQDAERNHIELQKLFYDTIIDIPNIMNFSYKVFDLNSPLPFNDNTFHKICCSLLISYVEDPLFTLKELLRVLKRGGRIVVSTLKPYPDISRVYCNFLNSIDSKDDIEEVRHLISSAGQIKRKEGEGYYRFFSQEELKALLISAGGSSVEVVRALGDQANVAVAVKRSN